MSPIDRLTRQELTWLLTQEARTAAQTLRQGVAVLSQPDAPETHRTTEAVESSLDTLDDAMKMLVSLNAGIASKGRRGKIDLAAVLCELAPNARVRIEPGSGTEVSGDEAALRRMIQVLLSRSGGMQTEHPEVSIERVGQEVRVSVTLGPDTAGAASSEHAWLSRMALRYGGRLELEGGQESLVFPAEGASERSEVEALRKELVEAQKQGEAYARELAAVYTTGEKVDITPAAPSTVPPWGAGITAMVTMAAALSADLRATVGPLSREGEPMPTKPHDSPEMQSCVSQMQETTADLAALGKVRSEELPAPVDVVAMVRSSIDELEPRARRRGSTIGFTGPARADAVLRPTCARTLARLLIAHAIQATPRGGTMQVSIEASETRVVLAVDDGGPCVPEGAREGLFRRRVDPASLGRPIGFHLGACVAMTEYLAGAIELQDSPIGTNRTRVVIPTF